ncbi:MAG: DUF362 domain-containing protein [Candidatus Heimdallarchaeota archaeon]|nr:DUF362 domain-containing protein [Candidatus Heimdallarchaeota archaeon]
MTESGKYNHKSRYGKVAVLPTSPESVIINYAKLFDLFNYKDVVSQNDNIILKINLSWTKFFPACSTPPWGLDGVIKKLKTDGYVNIVPTENQTVVTNVHRGFELNRWAKLLNDEGIDFIALPNVPWISYQPKTELLALADLFDPILIPELFLHSHVIHLPTMKTHGHTTTTGAMKNAFGGLIPKYRHHSHRVIHEVLVDLLAIQQEIHPSTFAVMDGAVCGTGAGPRTMDPYIGNILLSSFDQVAIDALSAKIMGFDPLSIPYIKLAHDRGLGMGDVDQIEILGMDASEAKAMNFGFKSKRSPIIRWDQRIRNTTYRYRPIKPLNKLLFHTPLFRIFIATSEVYHDYLWYPTIGKRKINKFLETPWGKLFETYDLGEKRDYPKIKNWDPY